jgi:hypothetical protein
MSIIKYTGSGASKVFNLDQAIRDGGWPDPDKPATYRGLRVVDRKNPKHKATVKCVDHDAGYGMYFVSWVGGGWNCLDHAIEQFKVSK